MLLTTNRSVFRCNPLRRAVLASIFIAGSLAVINPVKAESETRTGSSSVLLEEILVTARKREESVQDVPLSVTAYSAGQIEALKIRDLTNLSVSMPNVAMDDLGTSKGTANFSIRGLGINSSIPSIDPTVGLFVDGVYMGVNNGVILDMFDLDSVEVLRGPQGILFGRNVTGGAVLINTKKPGESFEAKARVAYDKGKRGGSNQYLMGSIGGPVTDTLALKMTAYYNDDEGGLDNLFTGESVGAVTQKMIRPVAVWTPNDNTELVVRYEYSDREGDGPATQAHTNGSGVDGAFVNYDRDSFDLSIDEVGYGLSESNFLAAELNVDVGFGDGKITNIFGWRDYKGYTNGDIDSQPVWLFHSSATLLTEQYSNELRYSGTFADKANVTSGLYYFTNDMSYHERRNLVGYILGGAAPYVIQDGGGDYKVDTTGVFAALDYDVNDALTLSGGLRYTHETKEADIASLSRNVSVYNTVDSTCSVINDTCPIDFSDSESWSSLSPKLGFAYELNDSSRMYGHWTRGYRSGGYNLRNTSNDPLSTPGPFNEESVDSFEVGYKSEFERGRLNSALFFNKINDMQREVNLPSLTAGVVQIINNTADAEIKGLELDGAFSLTDNLLATGSLGIIDSDYTKVVFDLNGDGSIDDLDKQLDLPRAAKLTWNIGLNYDFSLGNVGDLTSRISYAYRDKSAYTDNNLGFIGEQKILNAGLDLNTSSNRWVFSLYGKNLLDHVKHGGDTQLPATIAGVPVGGVLAPLDKGRHYGIEITYNYF